MSETNSKKFDYIVVGAGSAGCPLANRLSADGKKSVLLVEAGPRDLNPWIHIPIGYFKTMHNPNCDWIYKTQPDKYINSRSLDWPRGKVLGGSSSLQGLLYIRGDRYDYDQWEKLGNKGWGYKDVLPYFIKSENQENGANKFHGNKGELRISNLRLKREIAENFISACEQVGIPFNKDFNGKEQEGVGYYQQTAYKGFRCSSATAFLKPAKNRSNLTILTKAQTNKILFKDNKAIGIEFSRAGSSKKEKVFVNREIILSAGAIGSPQILQVSGIGDSELLKNLKIPVVFDNQFVGKNLQDHLQIRLVYKTKKRTLNDEVNKWWKKMLVGMQYIAFRTGPLTLSASQVGVFTNTKLKKGIRPDIQYHFQPLSADRPGNGVHPFSAFTISVCTLRPTSRGEINILSENIEVKPKIISNYLSTKSDKKLAIESIKTSRKIANAPALKNSIISEFAPGENYQTDEELLEAVKNYSQSIYHPVGTCKMGKQSDEAVVDERLRVYGVENLRIADASIMPELVSGNTNAPSIMIGEKAADMIIKDNV